jgi:hypothetical protein
VAVVRSRSSAVSGDQLTENELSVCGWLLKVGATHGGRSDRLFGQPRTRRGRKSRWMMMVVAMVLVSVERGFFVAVDFLDSWPSNLEPSKLVCHWFKFWSGHGGSSPLLAAKAAGGGRFCHSKCLHALSILIAFYSVQFQSQSPIVCWWSCGVGWPPPPWVGLRARAAE